MPNCDEESCGKNAGDPENGVTTTMKTTRVRCQLWEILLRILAVVNLLIVSFSGIWSSVNYVMLAKGFGEEVAQRQASTMKREMQTGVDLDACLQVDESVALTQSTYHLTSLIVLFVLVDICVAILLIWIVYQLTFNKVNADPKVTVTATNFWASYQILLIILLTLFYIVYMPLRNSYDLIEMTTTLVKFTLVTGWKVLVLWLVFLPKQKTGQGLNSGSKLNSKPKLGQESKSQYHSNLKSEMESSPRKLDKIQGQVEVHENAPGSKVSKEQLNGGSKVKMTTEKEVQTASDPELK